MFALLCAFGVCFILRGAFMVAGKGVPKGVAARIQDADRLRGWSRGTGVVHILWGVCAILLWVADTFPDAALYTLAAIILSAVGSVAVSLRTTYKYSDK